MPQEHSPLCAVASFPGTSVPVMEAELLEGRAMSQPRLPPRSPQTLFWLLITPGHGARRPPPQLRGPNPLPWLRVSAWDHLLPQGCLWASEQGEVPGRGREPTWMKPGDRSAGMFGD